MVTTVSGPLVDSSKAFRAAASWAMMVVFVAKAVWIAENTARVPRPGMPAVQDIRASRSVKHIHEGDQFCAIASHHLGMLIYETAYACGRHGYDSDAVVAPLYRLGLPTGLLNVADAGRVVLAREVGLLKAVEEGCAAGQIRLEASGLGQGKGVQHCAADAADHLHMHSTKFTLCR